MLIEKVAVRISHYTPGEFTVSAWPTKQGRSNCGLDESDFEEQQRKFIENAISSAIATLRENTKLNEDD